MRPADPVLAALTGNGLLLTQDKALPNVVGILTGVTAYFCGLSDPVLWGSAVFLLNYIPILGPMASVVLLAFTTYAFKRLEPNFAKVI